MSEHTQTAPEMVRGIKNPQIIDLISYDKDREEVVLLMLEDRPWKDSDDHRAEVEEKFNRYLAYVLDGFLTQQYPQYQGKRVKFRLECQTEPEGTLERMLEAMKKFALQQKILLEVAVTKL